MNRLKELRESKKMSQRAFAKQFNVSQGAVSGWETGRYDMSIEDMTRFAQFFNCSVDYLLGRSDSLTSYIEQGLVALNSIDFDSTTDAAEATELYKIFKQMPPEMQKTALAQLRALAEMNKNNTHA